MKTATSTLIFCVAALLALGMVMLYSSIMAERGGHYLLFQCVWTCLGLATCLIAANTDYRILKRFAWPLFVVSVLLLILVLVPHVGSRINGARRWFKEPHTNIRFEPSELAKISLIILLAWYGEHYQRQMGSFRKGILYPGIFIGLVLGLVFVEPDVGSMMLMASVSGALLLLAGVKWRFIVPPTLLAGSGLAYFLWKDPMRSKRIFAWLDVEKHKLDIGLQAKQAMLAFGSGGWTGLGLGNSRAKLGFLPEHHTDFIFPIIGEELGLVATLGVTLAFVLILLCGLHISSQARDPFGMLLGSGITCLIGLQAAINIGVVTNALPNKGLPLPFISYGGSDLVVMLTCVGILLSVGRHALAPDAEAVVTTPDALPEPQVS